MFKAVGRGLLLSALGLAFALMSSFIQRFGPEMAAYGNLCGPTHSELCMEPVLNGGFPFPFLFDAPGISVERQLAFFEDDLRMFPFLSDVLFYALAVWLIKTVVNARRSTAKCTEGTSTKTG